MLFRVTIEVHVGTGRELTPATHPSRPRVQPSCTRFSDPEHWASLHRRLRRVRLAPRSLSQKTARATRLAVARL